MRWWSRPSSCPPLFLITGRRRRRDPTAGICRVRAGRRRVDARTGAPDNTRLAGNRQFSNQEMHRPMIVTTPDQFRAQLRNDWLTADSAAVPRAVFLVEPADFSLSRQAARDNSYMDLTVGVNPGLAIEQHRDLTDRIAACGVPVIRFPGRRENPDDLFPNNVFGTIPGRFIVGAMLHPERQQEARRCDIRAFFTDLMGYREVDLSGRDLVAELTGALVMDRSRRLGFCGLTGRVDVRGCEAMHDAFELALTFRFDLKPEEYHTNVVMSVLASRALVICPDAFVDPEVPAAIGEAFPGHVLEITQVEKEAFAGNCLAVNFNDLFISAAAWRALAPEKRRLLESWDFAIHAVELDEIEKAGGSLRCCIGEIF
ncbi:MAG: amidinotransferase [Xanthomonadales bacterium]|nr:amidinotransferase [Xanthomonadales bacterium]